jgi:hypothetical protein
METAVNNPYPSAGQLRMEDVADTLLAEQAAAVTAFQAIVQTALDAMRKLHFPLGSPASGYDVENIESFLGDWLIERNPELTEALALDAARDDADWRGLEAA